MFSRFCCQCPVHLSCSKHNQFKWVKTNNPSKKISPHYTIGWKEGGLAHLEVDLANCSLAGEPFDRISEALILSIDLDVKDLMDFGDWPSSVREWVITVIEEKI